MSLVVAGAGTPVDRPTQTETPDCAVDLGSDVACNVVQGESAEPDVASYVSTTALVGSKTTGERTGTRATTRARVCAACIRANMEFLASDAMRGRGSGTQDELVAATYIASQLRAYGIEPAGDNGGYIQQATVVRRKFSAPPELKFTRPAAGGAAAQDITWTHGKEMLALYLSKAEFAGPLARMDSEAKGAKVPKGSVVLISGTDEEKIRGAAYAAFGQGAAGVILPASPEDKAQWAERGKKLPGLPTRVEGESEIGLGGENFNVIEVNEEAFATLKNLPDGTELRFSGMTGDPEKSHTWNAVGILRGRDKALDRSAVLFSAHLDHLGVGRPVKGDDIYNGADDDASGVVAVLELARVLGAGAKPRRTVIFALFGSEEAGGLGSTYFREHPPVPLTEIAANLEFEMIGRPDPAYPKDTLWLSGWERSNLGPTLAAHGAKLVGDKRPEQQFFQRSDNYVLAKKGVVAQTASSFGLHTDYHQPSDDVAHIDFAHMTNAIGSLIGPVEWLVNSDFKPEWREGGKP